MSEQKQGFPRWLAVAAVAVGLAGGTYGVATAASGSGSAGSSSTSASVQAAPAFNGPAHGTAAHEDAEKAVTGDAASKAQAAAVTAAGGGTAGAVTTDYTGSGYEVTITKSDGSTVEIHLDSSFNALQGHGDHGGPDIAPPTTGSGA